MDLEKRQKELEDLYNDLDQRKLVGIILELTIENIDLKKQLRLGGVVGRSEQFYCDGQENGKDRCKTQCLGCAGMQEIYGQ
jgi:hypothetical protein